MVSASKEELRHRYEKPANAASEGQPSGQAPKKEKRADEANFHVRVRHPQRSPSGVKPPPVATENELLEQGKAVWLWQAFLYLPAGNQPQARRSEDHPRSKGLW